MADNSIALGIQPMATPDYAGATMNRMNMMGNIAKLDAYKRQVGDQNALASMLQDPGFDVTNPAHRNALLGRPGGADVLKALGEYGSTTSRAAASDAEANAKNFKLQIDKVDAALKDITGYTTKEDTLAGIERHLARGDIDQTKASGLVQALNAAPNFEAWQMNTVRGLLDAKDRLAQTFTNQDTGGGLRIIAAPTYGGGPARVVEGSAVTKTMTPEQTAAANLAQYKAQYPELVINITPSGSVIGTNPRTGVAYALPVMPGSPPPMPSVPGAAAPGGGIPTGRATAPAGAFGSAIDQAVNAAIPNAAVSSAGRTTEKNAAVGGVPTSFHLTNDARDYTNFPGMTLAQGAAQLKQILEPQGYQVIYGTPGHLDHVHVEPGPALAARAPAAAAPAAGVPAAGVPAAVPAAAAPAVPASFVNTTQLDKQTSARDVLKAIGYDQKTGDNVVSSLIPQSTSGLAQAGVNAMKGAFTGTSTPGGEAVAALDGLVNRLTVDLAGGKLGVGFSDADRVAIKDTLGDAGNKFKPWNERQAAWNAALKVIVRNAGYNEVKIPSPKPTPTAAGKNGVDLNNPLFHKKPGAQ
jgi:hypothetical protein